MLPPDEETGVSKSWLEWTHENLARNCDPAGIVRILRDNNFSLPDIRAMMGERFPEAPALVEPSAPASEPPLDLQALRQKRESIVAIQRSLARLARRPALVERRGALPGPQFLEEYYARNRPVLLTGLMSDWPALDKWTPQYLKEVCGREVVEVMAGRESSPSYEIEDAPHRRNIHFSQFIDVVMSGQETNDYYLTARNNFFARPGVRPLLQDIRQFPDYLTVDATGNGIYLWLGPKGTVTPLHHDLMNIFMAQVRGRKQVLLVPPEELDLVYNDHAVYSRVDPANPDYERFPRFREATVMEAELGPGEVLFLPVGWWHYVKALEPSVTVTFNNFRFPNQFQWVNPTARP